MNTDILAMFIYVHIWLGGWLSVSRPDGSCLRRWICQEKQKRIFIMQTLTSGVNWFIYWICLQCASTIRPAHVAEWSALEHDALSGWASHLRPGASTYQRIISNNSYAHDEQGVNPRQVRGFDGVLYKHWPLLMPWLAASRCQPRWRELKQTGVAKSAG